MFSLDDARVVALQEIVDSRGTLMVAEASRHVPFPITRIFTVTGVPVGQLRGHHAHYRCHQMLICLNGALRINVDDGSRTREVTLSRPGQGLHIPPGLWSEQAYMEADTVALVLCDRAYEEEDYIRDRNTFLAWRANGEGQGE